MLSSCQKLIDFVHVIVLVTVPIRPRVFNSSYRGPKLGHTAAFLVTPHADAESFSEFEQFCSATIDMYLVYPNVFNLLGYRKYATVMVATIALD